MGKNDKYFDKLKGIKKAVTFDRSKKATQIPDETKDELDETKVQVQVQAQKLETLNAEKMVLQQHNLKLNKDISELRSEIKNLQIQNGVTLRTIKDALYFYCDGKHFEKSTFGTKVIDSGEVAKDCLKFLGEKFEEDEELEQEKRED